MFVLTVFVIPFAFVLVFGVLDWIVIETDARAMLADLSWDCLVLAWGTMGGVFSNPNISRIWNGQGQAAVIELLCVPALLLMGAILLALRKSAKKSTWTGSKVLVAIVVGVLALGVPFVIALQAKM